MVNLQVYSARICQTAAAFLIHGGRVLLVKHKKLGIWLAPGGHVEPNELPHRAAERECFEETGVKVEAFDQLSVDDRTMYSSTDAEHVPSPILTNLHWICRENYETRIADPEHFKPLALWPKGCEQHLNFIYTVRPTAGIETVRNETESDDLGWFSLKETESLATYEMIRFEIRQAFHLV